MALPIQDTPVLYGEDAAKFAENAKTAHLRPVTKEEYARAREIYEMIKNKNKLFSY